MSELSLEQGVKTLSKAANGSQGSNARLQARLHEVQALVGDDLLWVETALKETAADGPAGGTDAARHLIERGGKRVRPLALLLSAACFGAVPRAARDLAVVAELIHSATLLHDDVIDEGMERRGVPTSRLLFGNAVSVLGGDLMLVHALARTQNAAPTEMGHLVDTLRQLVEGEIVQLRGRTELDVRLSTYETVLRGKTASLFRWAAGAGARVGGANASQVGALEEFGAQLGMAFQLVDDVLDYSGDEVTGKTLYADLIEGKLTLPLVLTIEAQPELLKQVQRIHQGQREPVEALKAAVLASGACDQTRARAAAATRTALDALATLPASPARELLHVVARELTDRSS